MNTPPVVDEDVEHAEDENQERSRPLRLEADRHHCAGGQTNERHEEPANAPLSPEGESDEEEDKQDTSGEQEAGRGERKR